MFVSVSTAQLCMSSTGRRPNVTQSLIQDFTYLCHSCDLFPSQIPAHSCSSVAVLCPLISFCYIRSGWRNSVTAAPNRLTPVFSSIDPSFSREYQNLFISVTAAALGGHIPVSKWPVAADWPHRCQQQWHIVTQKQGHCCDLLQPLIYSIDNF